MGRADDNSPRTHLDAAADLCGVDLILECERAASRRNPRHRDPKRWSKTRLAPLPLHGCPRTKPRRLEADLRTIAPNQKPAGQLWTAGFFIAEARTTLSADLVLWNIVTIAEQPRLRSRIESELNQITPPRQSTAAFRARVSI